MTTAAPVLHALETPTESLDAVLSRMKEGYRKAGAPTHAERIATLEKLERALLARKGAIADAISRDFGHRSKHESLVSEVFMVQGAIKYAKAHLHEWMETEEREVGFLFLPARIEVRPQPVGVVGIISPWNYPVQLALTPLIESRCAVSRRHGRHCPGSRRQSNVGDT